jgi:1-acyl-sn-glycerol-3-phosphate acyltransferase
MARPLECEEIELYQDPLEPFTAGGTLLSLAIWSVGISHLAGWLSLFVLLDHTVMSGRRFDKLGKFVCRRVTDLAGIRVQRHGLHHLQPGASYVFCINHVSLLDLFVVFQSIPYFHRSFQDISHFKIPVYGGCIRVFGQVPVDRKNKELNRQAFERAVEMLHSGDSFVVFPEGHRTRDGRLGPFHAGAFKLAIQAQVPVVPMGMRGLRNVCPAGDWRIRPGTVDVLFDAPIPTEGLGQADVPELARRTRAALNELLARGPGSRPTGSRPTGSR